MSNQRFAALAKKIIVVSSRVDFEEIHKLIECVHEFFWVAPSVEQRALPLIRSVEEMLQSLKVCYNARTIYLPSCISKGTKSRHATDAGGDAGYNVPRVGHLLSRCAACVSLEDAEVAGAAGVGSGGADFNAVVRFEEVIESCAIARWARDITLTRFDIGNYSLLVAGDCSAGAGAGAGAGGATFSAVVRFADVKDF